MSLTLRRKRRSKPYAKVAPLAATTKEWAAPKAHAAKGWAAPKAEVAKEWAAPKVEPAVEKVREDVIPAVAGAVTAALAAAEPVRQEAASRGSAALAALKGELEPPKPKKHRLRKLFLLATVLGAAYAGWKAWSSSQARDTDPVGAWRAPGSTYGGGAASASSSTSSVTPVAPVDRPTTDDPAGAGPDEALADDADEAAAADDATTTPGTATTAGTATAAKKTTEKVTPAQAKKAAQAAEKGANPSS